MSNNYTPKREVVEIHHHHHYYQKPHQTYYKPQRYRPPPRYKPKPWYKPKRHYRPRPKPKPMYQYRPIVHDNNATLFCAAFGGTCQTFGTCYHYYTLICNTTTLHVCCGASILGKSYGKKVLIPSHGWSGLATLSNMYIPRDILLLKLICSLYKHTWYIDRMERYEERG